MKSRSFSTDDFTIAVYAEEPCHQEAIRRERKGLQRIGDKVYTYVFVEREPDSWSEYREVRVIGEVTGDTLGYLRSSGPDYKEALELWASEGYRLRCRAAISPAGRKNNRRLSGVLLDLASPEAIIESFRDPRTIWERSFRTIEAGDFIIVQPLERPRSERPRPEPSVQFLFSELLHRFRRIGYAAVVEKELFPFVKAVILHAYEEAEKKRGFKETIEPEFHSSSMKVVL